MVELTDEQKKVADAITEFALSSSMSYMSVAGYAGTGKTTVMGASARRILRAWPEARIAFCAPTGKAASVLSGKLREFGGLGENTSVGTVHSHIYRYDGTKKGKMLWSMRDNVEERYDLVVVDEASMVTSQIFSDLRKLNAPIIFVGDSGQLPPVGESLFQPLQETPYVLKTVHRQALENPIIRWATEVRTGGSIPYGQSKTFMHARRGSPDASKVSSMFMQHACKSSNIMLCGTNKTRQMLNRSTRQALKFQGDLPNKGEHVLCMRNMREYGVYNGQIFTVEDATVCPENDSCYLLSLEDKNVRLIAYAGALGWANPNTLSNKMASDYASISECMRQSFVEDPGLFDYGYACSVHKAQGSEWDSVLLFDERIYNMSDDDYRRWLYTGMTRAKNKLCIISNR